MIIARKKKNFFNNIYDQIFLNPLREKDSYLLNCQNKGKGQDYSVTPDVSLLRRLGFLRDQLCFKYLFQE